MKNRLFVCLSLSIFVLLFLFGCNKREQEIKNACLENGQTSIIQASKRMDILKSYGYTPEQAVKYEEYLSMMSQVSEMAKHVKYMEEKYSITDTPEIKKMKNFINAIPSCEEYLTSLNTGKEKHDKFVQEFIKKSLSGSTDSQEVKGKSGVVTEIMNASGYTYVQISDGKETVWLAAPEFMVNIGDKVSAPPGRPMPDYESKALNRKFDMVYFVPSVSK